MSEISFPTPKAGKESVKSFAMMKPVSVFFVGLFTTRRCQVLCYQLGLSKIGLALAVLKNSTATTHRCSPTTGKQEGWRQLAPLAESLVGHIGTVAQHVGKVAPLRS